MDALTQRVTLVRAEAERLQDYLGTLSPTAWHHPSACAEWEVGDVVAHLARGAEAYIEWITRGLRGDTAPPARAATADPANAAAAPRHAARSVPLPYAAVWATSCSRLFRRVRPGSTTSW